MTLLDHFVRRGLAQRTAEVAALHRGDVRDELQHVGIGDVVLVEADIGVEQRRFGSNGLSLRCLTIFSRFAALLY